MRDYELVVVLSPDVGDEGYPATIERISNFIQDRGGEIKNVDQWGRRRLAYPIHRHLEGYYAVTRFVSEPATIRPLEANLDLAEDVLRHLVIKLDEKHLAAMAAQPQRMGAQAPPPASAAAAEDEAAGDEPAEPAADTEDTDAEAEAAAEPEAAAVTPEN